MPLAQDREITAASRLDNVRYAIRDLAWSKQADALKLLFV